MKIKINKSQAAGTVCAPPSKSMAHRLLICGGLSKSTSIIHGISYSQDVLATLDALEAIGAEYSVDGDTVTIKGTDPLYTKPEGPLNCRESGSTIRFFVPIALLNGNNTILTGSKTLLTRPMSVYSTICEENGLLFSQDEQSVIVRGPLSPGTYKIPGNISSQFISGLLFALPLLNGDSTIMITPPVESRSYIDLTISALAQFGVVVERKDEKTLFIKGNQEYKTQETTVEGDYSNAAFYEAFNAIGGNITITGLNENSLQGDKVYEGYFKKLCSGTPTLHIADCPDLGPVLFAIAAAKHGGVFTGTKRLKIKESNRAEVMAEELKKFGVAVTVHEDSVVIYSTGLQKPNELLYGHNDHRIVMSLSVLLSITGGEIDGAEAVKKSFPDFFERISDLGIEVIRNEA